MSNFKVDWSQQPSKKCSWAEDLRTSRYTDPWYTGWCMKSADGGWLMYDCPNGESWCHDAEYNGYLLIHHPPEDKGKYACKISEGASKINIDKEKLLAELGTARGIFEFQLTVDILDGQSPKLTIEKKERLRALDEVINLINSGKYDVKGVTK
jgi:hypothetical protein